MASGPATEDPEKLLDRLRDVQRRMSGQSAADRRAALTREIEEYAGTLAPGRRGEILEGALGALHVAGTSPPGRPTADTQARVEEAASEIESLRPERNAAQASRDALLRDNARLRGELERKPPAAGGTGLDAFRAGLQAAIEGKKPDPQTLGLAPQDVRLFRMIVELIRFVLELEIGRTAFLRGVGVGPAAGHSTKMGDELQQQVRKRVLSILSDTKGSIAALQTTLSQQREFVIGVPAAFQVALPVGTAALLAELDPDGILERSKRLFTDYAKAWEEFVRTRSDLTNLTADELWDRFFKEPFQDDLTQRIGPR